MKRKKVDLLFFETYVSFVKNSVGSEIFKNFWAETEEGKEDLAGDGQRACAFWASNLLLMFGLVQEGHGTVDATVDDMKDHGWYEIENPKLGCVIVWEEAKQVDTWTKHLGFYIDDDQAISNDWESGAPHKHHWTYGEENGEPNREVLGLYWHDKLDNKYF